MSAAAHYREETEALRRAHARAPRAVALAEELIALEERTLDGRVAREVGAQADLLRYQADRGCEIKPDVEREVRLRYGLAK